MVKEFVGIEDLTVEDRLALVELNKEIYKPFLDGGLDPETIDYWSKVDVVSEVYKNRIERYKDCSTDCIIFTDGYSIWVIDTYKYNILFEGYYDEIKGMKVINQNYVFNKNLEKEINSIWGR